MSRIQIEFVFEFVSPSDPPSSSSPRQLAHLGQSTPSSPRPFIMFGMRAWPTPFLRPMWPFMVGAGITFYLVNAAQNAMLQSDEFKNSPKNPHRISSSPAAH